MKTVFNLAILLLSAFTATAEQSAFGVSVVAGSSVFGISRGGGLFGGKEKEAAVVDDK